MIRASAAAGALIYLATLLLVPLLAPSLDVIRLHPEDYATSTGGFLVPVGYAALALSAAALALGLWRDGGAWSRIAAAALAVAALTCIANAADPGLAVRRSAVELGVLGFLAAPIALLLRRGMPRVASTLAVAIALGFVVLFVAPPAIGGIVNRALDALIAGWCSAVALSRPRVAG